jgi:hypothetical protein
LKAKDDIPDEGVGGLLEAVVGIGDHKEEESEACAVEEEECDDRRSKRFEALGYLSLCDNILLLVVLLLRGFGGRCRCGRSLAHFAGLSGEKEQKTGREKKEGE